MSIRSNRAEVRNPVLALPSIRVLRSMPADYRRLMSILLQDMQHNARRRAQSSWNRRKAFVAAYWWTAAVYAGHVARALLDPADRLRAGRPFLIRQSGFDDLPATDWEDASRLYCARRDATGFGASQFPKRPCSPTTWPSRG